jgi:hypothetical protein
MGSSASAPTTTTTPPLLADTCVVRLDGNNEPHISGTSSATAFLTARVALVVSDSCPPSLLSLCAAQPQALLALARDLERLLELFDACVGKRPPVTTRSLGGRVRVEVDFLEGAAGLAHHGCAGFAVGPAFVEQCARSRCAGEGAGALVSHVFMYECSRNYIFPDEFTPVVDYAVARGAVVSRGAQAIVETSCWGWVNQGFVNVLGTLLFLGDDGPGGLAISAAFDYHGQGASEFITSMEAALQRHIDDSALSWADTFMHERLPWASHQSLDNVYSGLLVRLWRSEGRGAFLARFFQVALPTLRGNGRLPRDKGDFATARENLFLGFSIAARRDLGAEFAELRLPLRAGVAEELALLLVATS